MIGCFLIVAIGCPLLETLRNRNIGQPLPGQAGGGEEEQEEEEEG